MKIEEPLAPVQSTVTEGNFVWSTRRLEPAAHERMTTAT
jgi:hypothetical protein